MQGNYSFSDINICFKERRYTMKFEEFKQILKKNDLSLNAYNIFFKILYSLDPLIPMRIPIKLQYNISMGKKLDLGNPDGLNEKIQWLKVYYRDPLYVKCADKYSVRDFVKEQEYGGILNELYGAYEDVNEINFNDLPDSFALKTSHGCGTNIICDDKSKLDIEKAKEKINRWMKKTTGTSTGEMHYKHIKPRIIVEKYIGNDDGTLPLDYKVFCFNGEPYCIAVYSDRDKKTLKTNRAFFNFDWEPLDITTKKYYTDPNRFKKPNTLDEMYEVAKRLSKPFPFVRIDLYEYQNKVVFGEMTFTPTGGFGKAFTSDANLMFGKRLQLPEKSKTNKYVV